MFGNRNFRRRRRRFKVIYKRALLSVNHCEQTMVTVGGTELATQMFTSLDAPTNRSTMIPAGAVLKRVLIRLFATDATPVTGKHQCALFWRPASLGFSSPTGMIAGWYSSTDPLTTAAVEARKYIMGKVHTNVIVTGAAFPLKMTCSWKGNRVMRDGDDIILQLLDGTATNWYGECSAWYVQ